MSRYYARMQAEKLAQRLGADTPPIDVEAIARGLKLKVIKEDLGQGVSGLLVSDGLSAYICVQQLDAPVRQRFTIAHELGHYILRHHVGTGENVLVDRGVMGERGALASQGIDPKEIQANQFAACLLMPSRLVRQEVERFGTTPLSDANVSELAKTFKVSEQAMTIRLTKLGLL